VEITKTHSTNCRAMRSVVMTQLGVARVPAPVTYVRPWPGHVVGGLLVAPKAELSVKQNSALMTPAVDASPRKDAFARSGIRTEGPPV
jgi:hypothetical protein